MKSDDLIGPALIIGLVLWFVLGEDTETVYPLLRNETPEAGEPAWQPGAQTVYKIRGNQIVVKFGSIVDSYDSCKIFSLKIGSANTVTAPEVSALETVTIGRILRFMIRDMYHGFGTR